MPEAKRKTPKETWKATHVRLHPVIHAALANSSTTTGITQQRIINDALASFLGVYYDPTEVVEDDGREGR